MEITSKQLKMNLKLSVALLVGILVINQTNCVQDAEDQIAGLPILSLGANLDPTPPKTVCDPDKSFDCTNCTTRAICDSSQTILSTIECGRDAPFCDDGVCSIVPPESGCPQPASPLCPSNGTFPSTTTCTRYVKCTEDRKATEYQCPANLVYDPDTKFCKRRIWSTDCPLISNSCAFNRNKFIVYPLKKQIYFFCGASNNNIKVLICPDGKEFNPATIMCEKICTEVGFIEAPDKSKYFLCVKNGNQYDKYLQECPLGTKFDAGESKCITPVPILSVPEPAESAEITE